MSRFRKELLFLCDSLILIAAAILLARFSLRYALSDAVGQGKLLPHLLLLYVCTVVFQIAFHTYDSLWRYAESREYLSLLMAAFWGFCVYEIISRAVIRSVMSFVLLTAIASVWVLGMLLMRFAYRVYRNQVLYRRGSHQIPVAIIGAGAAGVQLLGELQSNADSRYQVQCFFDDDRSKVGKRIHGVEVKGTIRDIPTRLRAMDIRQIIVAIPSISEERRHEILKELSGLDRVKVSVLPSTMDLIEQKPIGAQLRDIQIEDLLGREPVRLDPKPVDGYLEGKVVMVTGGGGSIGSELCRQIAKHRPKQLVIVDIYENNAYDIQQELLYIYKNKLDLAVEIASIRDSERVRQLFAHYRPDVVFHAAAHKHVPLMEHNVGKAVKNNVFGTLNMADVSEKYGVEKFIMISTDKAVNPTNAMGASKRMCEMIVQSRTGSKTCFSATRFGNVLGSNGSVIPLFKRQILNGGPVTLTDKRIIRYFMTIPEASQLVLQSAAMARSGELYVLDMGKPVKILELAENMIRLMGFEPYRDIEIEEVGLRPGEKLYEELLIKTEELDKTDSNMIFVERDKPLSRAAIEEKLALLRQALATEDDEAVRRALKQVVPTYQAPERVNARAVEAEEMKEAVEETKTQIAG